MDDPAHDRSLPLRVLVAEDSPTQAQRLCHLLEQNGFEVAVGANGRLALEKASVFAPDIVISDVSMPELDGYEVAWHVKADPALRGVPVILVTTLSDTLDVIRGLECGADNFVLKPYDDRLLLERIRHLLANRGLPADGDGLDPIEIRLHGERRFITADRRQILNLLLSTCDAAAQRNKDLGRTQDELRMLNCRLDAAVAEMADANRFLDSVVENIPNVLYVKDAADLRYVRLNRAGQEFGGYSQHEVRGKTERDLLDLAQAERSERQDREVLASLKPLEISEQVVQTRYRGARTLRTRKVPILDGRNQPLYLLGIAEDVTEDKRREREILQLNAALTLRAQEVEAANRELDAFTASVSHDLRAPLGHIAGYAEMLERETSGQLSPDAERYLATVRRASAQMGQLIDDLLDFARTGRAQMQRQPVDLARVVADCREAVTLAAGGRRIDWHIGELPTIAGDEAMIRQVFANLLGNAVKYTSPRERAEIGIAGNVDENGLLVVQVRDNGIGFDMADADRLFGVFQRLHAAVEFEGSGLGLANVRRIVARHGGATWAESRPGEGATFCFSLPLRGAAETASAAPSLEAGPTAETASAAAPQPLGPPADAEADADPGPDLEPPREAVPVDDPQSGMGDACAEASETPPDRAAPALAAIAGAWEGIVAALLPVVGPGGAAALYQRSLYLTARIHPWIAPAHGGFQAPIDLRLLTSVLEQHGAEAWKAGLAHLQAFRTLLAALVGASLTEQLLRPVWTDILDGTFGSATSP